MVARILVRRRAGDGGQRGLLDGPWSSGFAYAVLLLGVGFISRAVVLPYRARPMERVQAEEEDRAAPDADADADIRHNVAASPDKVMAWYRYLLVSAPTTAVCAGLLDGPWAAAGFAYAALLLGVTSIHRVVSTLPLPLPPRRMEPRVQAHERQRHDGMVRVPPRGRARDGGLCRARRRHAGRGTLGLRTLAARVRLHRPRRAPLRPMERMLEDENLPVGNGDRRGAGTMAMDWTGYFVVASWAGVVEGPAAAFFAFALLLLGIPFVVMAMLAVAVAKPKMA